MAMIVIKYRISFIGVGGYLIGRFVIILKRKVI